MTKEFGSTYLCNRLSHRQLGEGAKVVTGGYAGVVIYDSHFSTTCTAVLVTDDDDDGGAVRTYDCFTSHCRRVMEDLQLFYASL